MAKRRNIVPVSRAGVRMGKEGTRTRRVRYVHARKGTRPASPGGMPYQPRQCVAKKPDGSRCKMKITPDPVVHVCHLHAEAN